MSDQTPQRRRACSIRFDRMAAILVTACLVSTGCQTAKVNPDETPPDVATYVRMTMPRRLEVQRNLTKPVSFAQDGNADGLEVVLAAVDGHGTAQKLCGTLLFDLRERRPASGDEEGPRVAFWPVKIDTDDASEQFFDRLSRYYHFPLQLEKSPLKPGRYILCVRLLTPSADTLFGEYEFEQTTDPAPNGRLEF